MRAVRLAAILAVVLGISLRSPGQSLRELADKQQLLLGTAVNPGLFGEPLYAATLAREFNMIEAENVMKWGALRPNRDTFDFKRGDQVVEFAKGHAMKVRGHCLVWAKYNPRWLNDGKFTAAELSRLLEDHITKVVHHYSGEVFAWDVVNEAFTANGGMEPSLWYDAPGIGLQSQKTAYIEQAFRWARAADAHALLFYNDYDVEGVNAKSDAMFAMAKDFRRRGVPIDGVGIQAHIFDLNDRSLSSLAANIARFTKLGLQVHITEFDVGLPLEGGHVREQTDLTRQAEIYRAVAAACLRQRGCTALQTWGFTDKYSWIPGYTKGVKGAALPFDQSYLPKPAYNALRELLAEGLRNLKHEPKH